MAIAGLMIVVGAGLTVAMPNLTRASSDLAWELQIGCVINLFGLLFLPLSLFRPLAEAGQRGYLINLLLLGQLLATTGASLIFAAAGGGLIGQFVALVVGSLPLYFGLTWDAIGRYPELLRRGLLRPEIGRQIRSLSWPTFLFNLSSRLRNQSDNILVALFLGPLTVAQFFLTQRVIALVGTQATTVGTAAWAGLVDLHYRGENQLFTLRLTQLTRFTAVISTALLLPVGIWNRSLISLWVGADQYAGPIVTSLAAINAWALSLFSLWGWMLSGSGLVRLTLPLLLVNTVINVVVSVAATGLIGVSGPLLGTLAAGLTRVRLRNRMVVTMIIFNLIAISLLIYHQVNLSRLDLWPIVFYLAFLGFLGTRARALKSRVAELVDLAAFRAGLQRVSRKGKAVVPAAEPELEVAVNATDPASPQLP
jgi:O-antigen/teichoic acid export membrane protein